MSARTILSLTSDVASRTCSRQELRWLDEARSPGASALEPTVFARAFASAGRRLRGHALHLQPAEKAVLEDAALAGVEGWSLARLVRIGLLVAAVESTAAGKRAALVRDLYRRGDNQERIAVLAALAALPTPEAFVETGLEACRSHVQDVFEAIACENRYPARYFPEHGFNQMVVKAMFTGVALARILELEGRRNAELGRMAADFASERRAAGRPVPADIALIL